MAMGRLVLFALSISVQSARGDSGISSFVSATQTQFLHSRSKDLRFFSQVVSGTSDKNTTILDTWSAYCQFSYAEACDRCKAVLAKCGIQIKDCGKGEIWAASCGRGGSSVSGHLGCSASTTYVDTKDDCTFQNTGDPIATAVDTTKSIYYMVIGGAVLGILILLSCIGCAVWLLYRRHLAGALVARSLEAEQQLQNSLRAEEAGASYRWNISAEQVTEAVKGTKLESPDFQLEGVASIFRIRFFPKGHKNAQDGNCSAYLWTETNVTMHVRMSVTDSTGASSKELNEAMKVIQAGKTVGTHNFCEAPSDGHVIVIVKVRDFTAGPDDEEWFAAHPDELAAVDAEPDAEPDARGEAEPDALASDASGSDGCCLQQQSSQGAQGTSMQALPSGDAPVDTQKDASVGSRSQGSESQANAPLESQDSEISTA